jgi:phosphoglycerate kinase
MFHKKTIDDIDINGKTVLVRADYNVPLNKDGKITASFRIEQSLPTLQALIERGCKVVICSHLGRPKDANDTSCSLRPVAEHLAKLLGKHIEFADNCIGDERNQHIGKLQSGDILLLENLRFHKQEEENDEAFAGQLAESIDIFVQDGFGVVHRAHASTDAITKKLPSVAGLLVQKEINAIQDVMDDPKKPLMAIIGGAKISDKIDVLNRFIDIADIVAIGGAMSNTFLLAQDIKIGDSLAEPSDVPLAREILAKAQEKAKNGSFVFYIPQDGVVAKKIDSTASTRIVDWGTHAIAEIEDYPKHPRTEASVVADDEKILDIGPFSGAFIAGSMQLAQTVVWNGAMGVTEVAGLQSPPGPFAHGTELIVEALLGQFGHRPYSLVGGGDTVGYVENRGLESSFDHLSTGGGASMELLSGKTLPGVEALENRE